MEDLAVGDVVVVPFPFTNLERAKRRPAFIVASLGDGDYISCQITSRPWPHAIRLPMGEGFTDGTLPRESYIRPEKLFTGNDTLVLSKAGHATAAIQRVVHKRLLDLFNPLARDPDAGGSSTLR